ncbi:hypothetical protein GJU40_19480 [Bacillus lacus]|uniref:O-antigen ligase-related domain-containing protein n=1 Tax=Metabacillus lacus TaxID=1983721 RepID=A0A7X2J2V7_9BACI|nr:O-antigen ligase family protein [Metabacillus lacus]MRX74304.1 hypothetical protein [Metabacillus lacus]
MNNNKLVSRLVKYKLEIGMSLCFLMPPLGILILIVIGWGKLNSMVNTREKLYVNISTFFFLTLAISAAGAAILERNGTYLLILAMVLGYLGLYLHIKETASLSSISRYQKVMIGGGIYLLLSGSFFQNFYGSNTLLGLVTGTYFIGGSPGETEGRLFGSAYNPNFTAFLLLLVLTFLIARLLKNWRAQGNILLTLLLSFVTCFAIFQTGSRSGIATMFLILLLFLFKASVKYGTVSLAVILLAKDRIIEYFPRDDDILRASLMRKDIWVQAVKIWRENPYFGTTSLGFGEAYAQTGKAAVPHAHNIFLAFFSEYGTFGGLAFLLLFSALLYKFVCLLFLNSKKKLLLNFYLLSFPVVVLTGILDHPLVSPQTALLTVILLGSFDRYTRALGFRERAALNWRRVLLRLHLVTEKPEQYSKTQKNKYKL